MPLLGQRRASLAWPSGARSGPLPSALVSPLAGSLCALGNSGHFVSQRCRVPLVARPLPPHQPGEIRLSSSFVFQTTGMSPVVSGARRKCPSLVSVPLSVSANGSLYMSVCDSDHSCPPAPVDRCESRLFRSSRAPALSPVLCRAGTQHVFAERMKMALCR